MQERKLGFLETKLALTQDYCADDKLCNLIVLDGELDFQKFIETLQQFYHKITALRCSLSKNNDGEYFLKDNIEFTQISKRHLQAQPEHDWYHILQTQLKQPFQLNNALWEVVLFSPRTTRHYLMLYFHHSIIDGISAAQFLHHLLTCYSDPDKLLQIAEQTLLPPAENLYSHSKDYATYAKALASLSMPPARPFEQQALLNQRAAKNLFISFKLAPLQAFSQQIGVKINAILATVLLLVMFERKNEHSTINTISLSTCVDLRKRISNIAITPDHVACLFNSITTIFERNDFLPPVNFVALAKKVEAMINDSINRYSQLPINAKTTEIDQLFAVSAQARHQAFPNGLDMSNLGQLPFQHNYGNGKLGVNAYFFFVNQVLGFSELLFNLASCDDKIFSHLTYIEPLHSQQWALNFYHHFLQQLANIIPSFEIVPEWTSPQPGLTETYPTHIIGPQLQQFGCLSHAHMPKQSAADGHSAKNNLQEDTINRQNKRP